MNILTTLHSLIITYAIFTAYAFLNAFGSLYADSFGPHLSLLIKSLLMLGIIPSACLALRKFLSIPRLRVRFIPTFMWTILSLYPMLSLAAVHHICPKCVSLSNIDPVQLFQNAILPAISEEFFFTGVVVFYLKKYWSNRTVYGMLITLQLMAHSDTIALDHSKVTAVFAILTFSWSQAAFALHSGTYLPGVIAHFISNSVTLFAPLISNQLFIRTVSSIVYGLFSVAFITIGDYRLGRRRRQ
ncbi:hypothetical protein P9112_004885 [Eukaryota sp. TZLM1-RC]